MLIETGTYTGTGRGSVVKCGWRPDMVIIRGGSNEGWFHHEFCWRRRSHTMGGVSAAQRRITITNSGFTTTTDTDVNEAGTVFHWVAIKENRADDFKVFSFCGTGYDNQSFSGLMSKKPELLFAKRDNTQYAQVKVANHADGVSKAVNAAAQNSNIKTLSDDGSFTTSNNAAINEFSDTGAGGTVGEATDCFAFYPSLGIQVQSYTGTGEEQTVTTTVTTPQLAFVIPTTANKVSMKTDTMGTSTGFTDATALYANGITAMGSGSVTIGTSTNINNDGDDYWLVTIAATEQVAYNNRPMYGSQIVCENKADRANQTGFNCGTADTCDIDGAISLEFHGSVNETKNGTYASGQGIFTRAGGTVDSGTLSTAGNYSWGLLLKESEGGLQVVTTNLIIMASGDAGDRRTKWRTGITLVKGREYHIIVTHDGSGNWCLYIDGILRKTRQWNMVTEHTLPNIQGTSGHMTGILGRASTSLVDQIGGIFYRARVYARELTSAEVLRRYRRQALNNTNIADVTDFAEEWGATAGTSSTLPATNDSNNNGSISAGYAAWRTRYT